MVGRVMFKSLSKFFGGSAGEPAVFHPTDTCPNCGSKLMRATRRDELCESQTRSEARGKDGDSCHSSLPNDGDAWSCPNPDCPPQVRARIEHWCSPAAMDIPGGDAAMVEKLVAHGLVRDVAELYRLKVKELAALPGMNKDSAQKFFDALTASLKRDAWRVLFGLAIPSVGVNEAQTLGKSFRALDDLFAAGRERVQKTSGVSEVVARSLADWYDDSVNRKIVTRLAKAGVNFKSSLYELESRNPAGESR